MSKYGFTTLFFSLALVISTAHADEVATAPSSIKVATAPSSMTPEDEWLITDRDREKPTLYDMNRQNVQYNKRYGNDRKSSYYQQDSKYYYDTHNSYNRSNYIDNTSPNFFMNR